MFSRAHLLIAFVVFLARIADVSLGTLRHVMIIRRKKLYAVCIAFFEALIWVFAVSKVLTAMTDPVTSIAFALGFATGTFVGMTIEGFFKIGDQALRIFSLHGDAISEYLRNQGFRVTVFEGKGRDGGVKMIFMQVKRRTVKKIFDYARKIDPVCFMVVDDISKAYTA